MDLVRDLEASGFTYQLPQEDVSQAAKPCLLDPQQLKSDRCFAEFTMPRKLVQLELPGRHKDSAAAFRAEQLLGVIPGFNHKLAWNGEQP